MVSVTKKMEEAARRSRGKGLRLTRRQRECYERIPKDVQAVRHPCFDDPDVKNRFFGEGAPTIKRPPWTLFPEVPDDVGRMPHRTALSKDDEVRLFLRYNYARYHLQELIDKQSRRPSKPRALAMLEWHDRTRELRSDLVDANMSLVMAMAKRTRIPNVDFSELVSEGNMALLRAIEKFDVSRGFKFSTYACRAILKSFNRMASKTGRYRTRFGTSYDPDLEQSDYDVRKHEMQRASAAEDLREVVDKNRANLTSVERTIVIERFGLGSTGKGKTLAQVGNLLGLSNERVRQIQKGALPKIREALNERYLTT